VESDREMRPHKEINSTVPQSVGGPVPSHSEEGGKRKGKHLKRNPRMSRAGNITREQIDAALAIDPQTQAVIDGKGTVKMLIYKREV
jgi:hypothetical protein